MFIEHQTRGPYLFLKVSGRLDATWADYFADTLLAQVRKGHHQLVIEAGEISYLSSAGIRSLMTLHKELLGVRGSFRIIHATDQLRDTLETTGLGAWLSLMPSEESGLTATQALPGVYLLDRKGSMQLKIYPGWVPWLPADGIHRLSLAVTRDTFALGIGSTAPQMQGQIDPCGEFLAAAGNVVFQPPEESGRPDYLMAQKDYLPGIYALQALACTGRMSHLIRFAPEDGKGSFGVSELALKALDVTGGSVAALFVMAEIDGLVGAWLSRSPTLLAAGQPMGFPEVRNWLSFCGERVFARHQAMAFGVVCRGASPACGLLPLLPGAEGLHAHIHAAVFPYQTLQNGKIGLASSISRFFKGAPPLALLHLVTDDRAGVGLGESAFIRGACWAAPITNPEVLS